jgi:hypothetical protein
MFRLPRKFRTERARRRHRTRLVTDGAIIGVGMLAVVIGILAALHTTPLTLDQITVAGSAEDTARIESIAQQAISGSWLHLIPRASVLFFPNDTLQAAVVDAFPKIEKVEVSREGLSGVHIAVSERKPAALWCGDGVPDIDTLRSGVFGEQCYFMDSNGFIYERAPTVTGAAYPRFWGAIAQGTPEGSRFVLPAEFAALTLFMRHLRESGTAPLGVLLVDENEMELYDARGTRILLPRGGDLAKRARTVRTVEESGIVSGDAIEYIDLRFGDKIYFKRTHTAESEAVPIP